LYTHELSTVSTGGGECFLDPEQQPESASPGEPELPGEFVSEDERADCARFLEDVRALIERRAGLPYPGTDWVPGRGD
jgi:hypothetical protein